MRQEKHSHYILHKPFRCLSQFINNQSKRKNKKLLGDLYEFAQGTMAIGRLDETSEGLLLLTTNGKLSAYVSSQKIEKEYYVQVDGLINEQAIEKLRLGVIISIHGHMYTTKKCRASLLKNLETLPFEKRLVRADHHGPTSWVSITLTEGKFRQIRKMTAAVNFPTLRLVRIRIGSTTLTLGAGEVLQVNQFALE